MQHPHASVTPQESAASTELRALLQRLDAFPYRHAMTRTGTVGYREAGASAVGVPVVLLHGIGSGAASWLAQFEALGATRRLLAWDAPGYGESTPVKTASPVAQDYAEVLEAWLDAQGMDSVLIVGHSLGAVMAAALARRAPQRVRGLLLCSPAAGYGAATEEVRVTKRDARLALLDEYGPQGLADKRSGNLLAPNADAAARAWVQWNMSHIVPSGYRQATHLLANADLAADVRCYAGPIQVAVGAADAVTTPAACELVAQAAGVPLQRIDGAGHACYIETPDVLNMLIDGFAQRLDGAAQ